MSQLRELKLGLVGCGNMGGAILRSLLPDTPFSSVSVLECNSERAAEVSSWQASLECFTEVEDFVSAAPDLLLLAVKPQDSNKLLSELSELSPKLLVSIMVGISSAKLQSIFSSEPDVARVMPNLALTVSEGVASYCTLAKDEAVINSVVEALFRRSCPIVLRVENDDFLDRATAAAGSGPAFVLELLRHYSSAVEALGFSQEQSLALSEQVFRGTLSWLGSESAPLETLIEQVTSKGGTTAAGREVLSGSSIAEILQEVLKAAYCRAVRLR